jgi:hypothetical protein
MPNIRSCMTIGLVGDGILIMKSVLNYAVPPSMLFVLFVVFRL